MSEKRKPELTFIATYQGNNGSTREPRKPKRLAKVELYPASLWAARLPIFGAGKNTGMSLADTRGDVYRIRVNGKWWKPGGKQTFTLSEFFMIFRKSVTQARKARRQKARLASRQKPDE